MPRPMEKGKWKPRSTPEAVRQAPVPPSSTPSLHPVTEVDSPAVAATCVGRESQPLGEGARPSLLVLVPPPSTPRKLGKVWWYSSLPPSLIALPSCCMVVGHLRLTWGTVLRDPGLRPFSSDSSLRWKPPSGPCLQVCRHLVALGLCFMG